MYPAQNNGWPCAVGLGVTGPVGIEGAFGPGTDGALLDVGALDDCPPFPLDLGDLDDFPPFPPFPLELGALDDFPPFPLELEDLDE